MNKPEPRPGTAWTYGLITVTYADGRLANVVGLLSGPLAVHPAQLDDASVEWRITHVRSGFRIVSYDWWDDAMEVAERLLALEWDFDGPGDAPPGLEEEVRRIHSRQIQISASRMIARPSASPLEGRPS